MTVMPGLEWLFGDPKDIPDPAGRAKRAIDFQRLLKHPKSTAPDNALIFDPWMENLTRRILGPVDEDGNRLVQTVYLQVGKGSHKTSWAAVMALIFTFGPERIPDGASYVVAADKAQARVAFREALGIVNMVPRIAGVTRPIDSKNQLIHPKSGASFEALPAGGGKIHGRTPNFILVDELWAHQKAATWEAMRENADKDDRTLTVIATTAGRGNESPDYPVYERAKRIQAGEIVDPSFLPVIFEASADDDPFSETTWHKVLPGLKHGYPSLKKTRIAAQRAQESPSERASFEQFKLGIRQDNSLSGFIPMSIIDDGKVDRIDIATLKERRTFIGVDASTKIDLTAVVACFPMDDGTFNIKSWGFIPENQARRRADSDGVDYIRWQKEGWVQFCPGEEIDNDMVVDFIRGLTADHNVRDIAFDPAYSQPIRGPLNKDGHPTTAMRQGWVTQSPALNALEGAFYSRKVKWDSPVLRWCLENVVIHTDSAGNRTMHKGKSRDRIDLAAALWMAFNSADIGDEPSSFYASEAAKSPDWYSV